MANSNMKFEPLTVSERLDAARNGEEFGAVILGLFAARDKAKRWPRWRIFRYAPGAWRIVHEHEPGTIPPVLCADCLQNYQTPSGADALARYRDALL